jgi:hypothetical protein
MNDYKNGDIVWIDKEQNVFAVEISEIDDDHVKGVVVDYVGDKNKNIEINDTHIFNTKDINSLAAHDIEEYFIRNELHDKKYDSFDKKYLSHINPYSGEWKESMKEERENRLQEGEGFYYGRNFYSSERDLIEDYRKGWLSGNQVKDIIAKAEDTEQNWDIDRIKRKLAEIDEEKTYEDEDDEELEDGDYYFNRMNNTLYQVGTDLYKRFENEDEDEVIKYILKIRKNPENHIWFQNEEGFSFLAEENYLKKLKNLQESEEKNTTAEDELTFIAEALNDFGNSLSGKSGWEVDDNIDNNIVMYSFYKTYYNENGYDDNDEGETVDLFLSYDKPRESFYAYFFEIYSESGSIIHRKSFETLEQFSKYVEEARKIIESYFGYDEENVKKN